MKFTISALLVAAAASVAHAQSSSTCPGTGVYGGHTYYSVSTSSYGNFTAITAPVTSSSSSSYAASTGVLPTTTNGTTISSASLTATPTSSGPATQTTNAAAGMANLGAAGAYGAFGALALAAAVL